jgi:hypothetical protein
MPSQVPVPRTPTTVEAEARDPARDDPRRGLAGVVKGSTPGGEPNPGSTITGVVTVESSTGSKRTRHNRHYANPFANVRRVARTGTYNIDLPRLYLDMA